MEQLRDMELEYTSAGCNRCVGNIAWNGDGIVAYGSHRVVVLYDVHETGRVKATLLGHEDVVTSVAWVPDGFHGPPNTDGRFLVSGGGDGCICVWKIGDGYQTWELCQKIEGHGGPVTCLAVEHVGQRGLVMVSGGGDGDVVVYTDVGGVEFKVTQRLSFGTKLVHCAALGMLPGSQHGVVLALGCVDGSVKLYTDADSGSFAVSCVLSGHQNWIRGLDFVCIGDDKLMLATASQDRYIRLWSIEDASRSQGESMLSTLGITKYAPKPQIRVGGRVAYTVILEALLIGHEDWVMSVAWNMKHCADDVTNLTLLSSSMDRTMILWKKDVQSGVWLSSEVVGDAGINHLGYYTCSWGCNGESIAAHGYTGALHVWDRVEQGSLVPRTAGSGHMGAVVDSSWSIDGSFLLTVSEDQTARIFAETQTTVGWCEIARPQVHGHDFSCAAMVWASGDAYRYVSGSEEKVLRVFESPRAFLDTLMVAQGQDVVAHGQAEAGTRALGATLPALGLSNKAVLIEEETQEEQGGEQSGGGYDDGADLAPTSAPSVVTCPPLEEHLSQNTLWPETHKLYGHGNDVYCVAASPRGDCVASASRAQSVSTAGIIVWSTASWTLAGTLDGHTLTVTSLEFSPCGEFLVSVGRDRKMCVFKRGSGIEFARVCHLKAHARVIWGVAWSPDSKYIVTASRDSTMKIWRVHEDGMVDDTPVGKVSCESSVQSVSCKNEGGAMLIAAGLENGIVQIYRFYAEEGRTESVCSSPLSLKHAAAVRRVQWRPGHTTLSSVGDDHSVKIWNI